MKYKKGTYFFLIMINKIIIAIIIVMANKHPNITTRTTVSKLLEVSPEIKFIKSGAQIIHFLYRRNRKLNVL